MPERPRRVEQPSFRPPAEDDPLRWASLERARTAWFRFVGPQLGLQTQHLIRGHVLNRIIGDDSNAYIMIHDEIPNPQSIATAKAYAEERLDWELTTPETPEQVKEKLRHVQEIVSQTDWLDAENFKRVEAARMKLITEVREIIDQDPSLRAAVNYANSPSVRALWEPPWRQFLRE